MPFGSKTELESTIATWLARSDVALLSAVPDFVRLAEADFEGEFDATFQDEPFTGTLDTSGEVTLPAGLYVRRFSIDSVPTRDLILVSPDELNNLRASRAGGLPSHAYRSGQKLLYAPTTTQGLGYSGEMVKVVTKLADVGAAESTEYLTHYFDALLYGSLIHAAPFLKADGRMATWEARYARVVERIHRLEFRKRTGGMVLRVRPNTWA